MEETNALAIIIPCEVCTKRYLLIPNIDGEEG